MGAPAPMPHTFVVLASGPLLLPTTDRSASFSWRLKRLRGFEVLSKSWKGLLREGCGISITRRSLFLVLAYILGVILDHHRLELSVESVAAQRF